MIAIVIPYYKLVFFEETLQSLARQTDKRFKVYVGDDASPDDCIHLIKNYSDKIEILYKRFNDNIGSHSLTTHWERCIDLIDNKAIEWIMILGDDDVLDENVVHNFYNTIPTINEINIIRFASQVINEKKENLSSVYTHPILENPYNAFIRKLDSITRSSLSEYIFRKSVFHKFKFTNYPLAWYSDDKAWLDFSESKNIYSINTAIVKIRLSNFNISGNTNALFKEQKVIASIAFYYDVIDMYFKHFTKHQKIQLLYAYEEHVREYRKIKHAEWFFILKKSLELSDVSLILKFLKRSLLHIIGYPVSRS